ncbi:bifunctional YncE family protein/alkaline phosphatase family protein [Streptomyces kebangsaanensis]|uniref:Bifunctional YncE family protein/alkaline phosphatase family protein n=1 Tax=Streptomyces kebangsaanensis TaxID=864058 RepID=A0ABW6KVF4_9ACTN
MARSKIRTLAIGGAALATVATAGAPRAPTGAAPGGGDDPSVAEARHIAPSMLADKTAGPRKDGTAVTPVGYRVTPAGDQTRLGNLPLNAVLHPGGRYLLVTNNGQGVQSLQLVDTRTNKVVQTLSYPSPESLYIGLAWSPDGRTAYASAAANSKIRVLSFAGGRLTERGPIKLPTKTADGKALTLFPAGLAVTPEGKKLVVADQLGDAVTVADTASGRVRTVAAGHRPVWVTLGKDGHTAYVSNQGSDTVDIVDVAGPAPQVTGQIKVGLHPNKSVLSASGRRLYVANGDADSVSEVDLTTKRVTRSFSMSPSKEALIGSNPTGLALDGADKRLFVTNSGNNSVSVVDLTHGKVLGRIPTGWYPSAVIWHRDRLRITNARGLGAGPNNGPGYPDPERSGRTSPSQYVGSMIVGTLSSVDVPESGEQLDEYTSRVERNNAPLTGVGGAVVPRKPGDRTPIKHVIYVVKENRSYDQVLGSLGKGNGDPGLNLFGDESAPNTRELARRFTTIDNFYAAGQVSASAWNWVTQSNSNPYVEQIWPAAYSGRKGVYPSERNAPENAAQDPQNSYLWQRLDKAGVSFANFGFYVTRRGNEVHAGDPVLDARTDHAFQDELGCPDSAGTFAPTKDNCLTPRVDQWLKSFREYEAEGDMPTVQFVRFPGDHTFGTTAGRPTPKAMVADNDYALGRLVDAVSHSRFWKDTVVLVTEDEAQNGPDHVDAHRTLALAISPYTQTGKVDSTFYSTASMVRTVGLFAGIGPLTQFDDYSTPMRASFTDKPNYRSYSVIKPTYPMNSVNGPGLLTQPPGGK